MIRHASLLLALHQGARHSYFDVVGIILWCCLYLKTSQKIIMFEQNMPCLEFSGTLLHAALLNKTLARCSR